MVVKELVTKVAVELIVADVVVVGDERIIVVEDVVCEAITEVSVLTVMGVITISVEEEVGRSSVAEGAVILDVIDIIWEVGELVDNVELERVDSVLISVIIAEFEVIVAFDELVT